MEKDDVKSTCGGTTLDFENENKLKSLNLNSDTLQLFLIQNLTRRNNFQFKIWRVVKFLIRELARCTFYKSNVNALYFSQFKTTHVVSLLVQNHAFQKAKKRWIYVVFME